MTTEEIIEKLIRIKMCIMVHPDNTEDSEFEDRIIDLEDIENALKQ